MKFTYHIPSQKKVEAQISQPVRQPVQFQPDAFLRELETHFTEPAADEIKSEKPDLVELGTVSNNNPTVSHLLVRSSQFKNDCWKIIHGNINRNKEFTKIQAGTKIYINPETKELIWNTKEASHNNVASNQAWINDDPDSIAPEPYSEKLANAMTPYFGKSYDEIDCYELLVNGLKDIGVPYTGPNGLKTKLVSMASTKGLPKNAYLNGEGITQVLGAKIYTKVVTPGKNTEKEANDFYNNIKPYLKKGYILSFSTPGKGHTGIINQKDGDWTYINSGHLDNMVDQANTENGVGEEYLKNEIKNWFFLAKERKESLSITLGKLNSRKMTQFLPSSPVESRKA